MFQCLFLLFFIHCSLGSSSFRNTRIKTSLTYNNFNNNRTHIFVTLGASGDLAHKKIYPTLWWLYRDNLLPTNTLFYGYARSKITLKDIREKSERYMNLKLNEQQKYEEFWQLNRYVSGQNTKAEFEMLNQELEKHEQGFEANRIFYMALPPSVYENVTYNIKNYCMSSRGWTRIVIEKPFGRDLQSSEYLSNHLKLLFLENQIYRIDHYLGKEMVQNLMAIRFGNRIFSSVWNKDNIASVHISFKETIGTQGRGGYFDEFGIIRDVMQNHMLQMLSLITMEKPQTYKADDIRDAKVNVLKNIPSLELQDVILGQYVSNPRGDDEAKLGYLDDPTVPKNSVTPTYALGVLHINNDKWNGVPFILECGKALNERLVQINITFKDEQETIFSYNVTRNELIIRIQPGEALHLKLMVKSPGQTIGIEESEMNLTYSTKYPNVTLPEAYERLILDVFAGTQVNFVRTDEVREAWRIFTPLLHKIKEENVQPVPYVYRSIGPQIAYDFLKNITSRNKHV